MIDDETWDKRRQSVLLTGMGCSARKWRRAVQYFALSVPTNPARSSRSNWPDVRARGLGHELRNDARPSLDRLTRQVAQSESGGLIGGIRQNFRVRHEANKTRSTSTLFIFRWAITKGGNRQRFVPQLRLSQSRSDSCARLALLSSILDVSAVHGGGAIELRA